MNEISNSKELKLYFLKVNDLTWINITIFLLAATLLSSCRQTLQVTNLTVEQYRMTNDLPADSAINKIIEPYRKELSKAMNVVIGNNETMLLKTQPEGTLNNFVGDLLYERTTHHYGAIDFAISNYGGLRIPSIPPGPIVLGKIYELMPFDNQIVILKMKGMLLQQLLDKIAEKGGWPISEQLRFTISREKAIDVSINGEELNMEKTYTVSIPDYIANGGDNCDFLQHADRVDLNMLVRDVMVEYVKMKTAKGEAVSAVLDQRIQVVNK